MKSNQLKLRQENYSIKKILSEVNQKKILLPSIQRTFVWDVKKIQNFCDSIFSNYPIGLFLFWKINRAARKKYNFYEFSKDVHKDYTAMKAKPTGNSTISVLDGQQRLTSLYCAFYGTHEYKLPKKHDLARNYRKRVLCVNLFYDGKDNDKKDNPGAFQFEFREENDILTNKNELWFQMPDLVDWTGTGKGDANKFISALIQKNRDDLTVSNKIIKNTPKLKETLIHFFDIFHKGDVINVHQVETPNIDTILTLFIRVNSGGLVLSRTDLLFSTITAKWQGAKELVEGLMDDIYRLDFKFNKDMIMRTCLMLTDCSILFSVDKGFSPGNIEKIKNSWYDISASIIKTVKVLKHEWGISDKHIGSKNSIIPIIYFFYKGGSKKKKSLEELKKYFFITNLKNHFSSHGDAMLRNIRKAMWNNDENKLDNREFSLERIKKSEKVKGKYFDDKGEKSFKVDDDDIDYWMETMQYPKTFFLLYVLYDNLNFTDRDFHQDHIHPKVNFNKYKNTDPELWKKSNSLPNLMFLKGSSNTDKNSMPFEKWVQENYKDPSQRSRFLTENYIPKNRSLKFSKTNFEKFYESRRKIMHDKLLKLLN